MFFLSHPLVSCLFISSAGFCEKVWMDLGAAHFFSLACLFLRRRLALDFLFFLFALLGLGAPNGVRGRWAIRWTYAPRTVSGIAIVAY
jgi:hypothetical protein